MPTAANTAKQTTEQDLLIKVGQLFSTAMALESASTIPSLQQNAAEFLASASALRAQAYEICTSLPSSRSPL